MTASYHSGHYSALKLKDILLLSIIRFISRIICNSLAQQIKNYEGV